MKHLIKAVVIASAFLSAAVSAAACSDIAAETAVMAGDKSMSEMLVPQCELGRKFRQQGRSVDSLVRLQDTLARKMRKQFEGKLPVSYMENTEQAILNASLKGYASGN